MRFSFRCNGPRLTLFLALAFATASATLASAAEDCVHGWVTGQTAEGENLGPVAGAKVELQDSAGKTIGSATSDATGYYQITGVSVGNYGYALTADGYLPERAGRGFEFTVDGAHVLDFVLTQGTTEPPATGNLNVRVLDSVTGKPIASATVLARLEGEVRVEQAQTRNGGIARLTVAPGNWRAAATAEGYHRGVHPGAVAVESGTLSRASINLDPITTSPSDAASPEAATPATGAPATGTPATGTPPAATPTNGTTPDTPLAADGTESSFFRAKAAGKTIVYIVDNSLSMKEGRFGTATRELLRSVRSLSARQKFYVIFFSDTAHAMHEPNSPAEPVAADWVAAARLEQYASTLGLIRGTNALPAVERALAFKPDVIYILSDGAFTDRTRPYLLRMEPGATKIHTIGFRPPERAVTGLQRIAERHGGTYTEVP